MARACDSVSARSPTACGRMRHDRNMMPSATRPMMSSGWREFFRVRRLRNARTAAIAPSPMTQSAGTSGTPFIATSPTRTQGRNALALRTTPAASGTKYPRIPGVKITDNAMLLRVLELLVPCHLNRLELRLVRGSRIIAEAVERHHVLAQVGEPNRQRIDAWKLLRQGDADVFRISPFHFAASCGFRSDFPSWMPPPSCT